MALVYNISQSLLCNCKPYGYHGGLKIKSCRNSGGESRPTTSRIQTKKRCLRCTTLYSDHDNSPTACPFHGHTTGEKGLFSLAPPHQGIDGEWSDGSGVIVYRWNEKSKGQTLEVPTGRKDGVAVPSMMKMPHLVDEDGMFPMMMDTLCIEL